ncbi:MAG: DUF2207 domain-containing protein [Pseudomonadota bacterium]
MSASTANLFMRHLLALFMVLATIVAAHTAERILLFASDITVNADGSLQVIETIRVNAEGQQIRRGIFRDFPTVREENGREVSVPFSVLSVTRDGRAENYAVERGSRAARVRIGNADVFLRPGVYEYQITYRTNRQLRYFENHDELFWNVTGNAWDFPIDVAAARVTLPQGTPATEVTFFTGRFGATERNATGAIVGQGNIAEFRTTAPLAQREGLSIGVKFPKGFIAEPSGSESLMWWLRDNLGAIIAYAGLAGVLAYYFWGWNRVGRDPPAEVVVPRWDLPDGVSPALTHYIENKGLKGQGFRALSAAALNLAVKGIVDLDNNDGEMTIKRTQAQISSADLPVGERALINRLDGNGGSLTLNKANGKSVKTLATKFADAMEKEHRAVYYKQNTGYMVFGVVLSAATLIGTLATAGFSENELAGIIPFGFLAIFMSFFIPVIAKSAQQGLAGKIRFVFMMLFFGVFALGSGSALLSNLSNVALGPNTYLIGALAALLLVNLVFFFLMGAPTPLGQTRMAEVKGLKRYLTVSEADRMNMLGSPEMSPQHYETLLPYAVALDVEKPWTKAFQTWLAAAVAAGGRYSCQLLWATLVWRRAEPFRPGRDR